MSSLIRPSLIAARLEARETPDASAFAVLTAADGTELFRVAPYGEDFTGGVRTAVADVTGDGVPDLITAPGAGIAPTVKVYDGATFELAASFDAYEAGFTGGVNVAAADVNGDGRAEIATGADLGGGPRARVLDGESVIAGGPVALIDMMAIEDANFRGGVRIGLGDLTGDGVPDLLVGAGEGGGPRVAGYDGTALAQGEMRKPFQDFFSHDPGLRHGTRIDFEDVNADGVADLLFGAAPTPGVRDRFISGMNLINTGGGGSAETPVYEYFVSDLALPRTDRSGNDLAELIPVITNSQLPVDLTHGFDLESVTDVTGTGFAARVFNPGELGAFEWTIHSVDVG